MIWLVLGWTSMIFMGMGHLIVIFLLLFGHFGHDILAPAVGACAILDYIFACVLVSCWDGQNIKSRWLSRLLYVLMFVKPTLSGILSLVALIVVLGEKQSTSKLNLIFLYVLNTFLVIILPILFLLLLCTRKPPKEKEVATIAAGVDIIPTFLDNNQVSKENVPVPGAGWSTQDGQFIFEDHYKTKHFYQFRVDKADSV